MENTTLEPTKSEPGPKVIGLTGGIGSGKSTVANIIEKMGYPVYYSDARAKEIVNEDLFLKEKIIEIFGSEAYDEKGLYNRKFISGIVFNDKNLLERLNETIHPAVKFDFKNWTAKQASDMVFKETALLFELKLHKKCDKTVLVTADDNLRIKRVMDRDNKTYREVEAVMDNQMAEKDKIKKADCTIYNNGSIEELETKTRAVIAELITTFKKEDKADNA